MEVKELIAQEETAVQHNQELLTKLDEERKKFEGLLDEKLEVDERLLISTKSFVDTKEKLKVQEEILIQLKAQIEG